MDDLGQLLRARALDQVEKAAYPAPSRRRHGETAAHVRRAAGHLLDEQLQPVLASLLPEVGFVRQAAEKQAKVCLS